MRVVATPEVVEFIRESGGQIFVWTVTMEYGYARGTVFVLEASVDSPGAEREFLRFGGEGIEVLYDPGERGTPDALHLALRGRVRKRVVALWNGHSFASE
ncbi:MAG: hypothetical protein ABI595_01245 [Actinomycetota bacterium]